MTKATAEAISVTSPSSCPTATAIREQARFYSPDVILPDCDISAEFLQKLLAKFKVEAVIDEDGELEVGEAFGPVVFIRLEPKRHWIVFHSGFATPTLSDEERIDFANYLSNNLAMAQFAATDCGIGMGYFMYYRGGLNVDQFMDMAQRFGSLACAAIKHLATFASQSDGEDEFKGAVAILN